MSDVTEILALAQSGESLAAEQLLPIVYDELRKVAAIQLAREKPGQTLQPTALVHEAYLRLVGKGSQNTGLGVEGCASASLPSVPNAEARTPAAWQSRSHFFAAASEAMRRILVEAARRRQSLKRGAKLVRHDVNELEIPLRQPPEEVLAVHDALDKLADTDKRAAELVKLRYFAGFTLKEAAEILEIAPRTADDVWAYARAWLAAEIESQ
jgi:RNA polymerase sigma factor (sigma-70 family)